MYIESAKNNFRTVAFAEGKTCKVFDFTAPDAAHAKRQAITKCAEVGFAPDEIAVLTPPY